MENILKKIVDKKKESIANLKKEQPINSILNNIKSVNSFINFKEKMKKRESEKKISIIAEIKKASPSAGLLVDNFNHLDLAKIFVDNGASFLSVLTEENYFLGKINFIQDIKKSYEIPILCKDFFIDTYQVSLAKSFGADCILIILSAIDSSLAKDLYDTANDLKISTIVEVHSEKEAEAALFFEKSIIGINNRNLKTLETSLNTTLKLSKILQPHNNPLISESGIHSKNEVRFIVDKTKIINFLIGESLLTGDDIALKLKEFTQLNV